MAIKVFADGANLEGMLDMYENGNVQGFTTNPSLMKKGGVTDYRAFAKEVLTHITDVSVSFEVFADDVETMEVEAREIATWAENVYVKIPCVTTKGESTAELVRKLSADGIKVNVTTIFTPSRSMRWSRPLTPRRRPSSRSLPAASPIPASTPFRL
ncbi:MAG: transaldolase family protein [Collinsella sp.]